MTTAGEGRDQTPGQPEHTSELHRLMSEVRSAHSETPETVGSSLGTRELGDFRLIREIGRGGMGTVWEAEQKSLGRRVALKLLAPHLSLSQDAVDRFHREAAAGGRLNHSGIVSVYEIGEAEGVHFIAQELVPGGYSLAGFLADMRAQQELPDGYYRAVAELFAKVADALQAAHDAGVVHRDLKPGNILLAGNDQPKVADFGLAKINDDLVLSRTGELAGTPYYMSPEQAMSKRIGIDHRTDIFSLGATLYEALTLHRPFDGDTSQQVLEQIVMSDPPDPRRVRSKIPWDLAVICQKAMEKKREHRYSTMADLAGDLQRYLADEPIVARPPGPMTRTLKWTRRHPVVSVSGSIAAMALVVITWLLVRVIEQRTELKVESEAKIEALTLASNAEDKFDEASGLLAEVNQRVKEEEALKKLYLIDTLWQQLPGIGVAHLVGLAQEYEELPTKLPQSRIISINKEVIDQRSRLNRQYDPTAGLTSETRVSEPADQLHAEMTPQEILDRVVEAYSSCRSFRDTGTIVHSDTRIRPIGCAYKVALNRGTQEFRFAFSELNVWGKDLPYIVWSRGERARVREPWTVSDEERVTSRASALTEAEEASSGSSVMFNGLLFGGLGMPFSTSQLVTRLPDVVMNGTPCFQIAVEASDLEHVYTVDAESFLIRMWVSKLKTGLSFDVLTMTLQPEINVEIDSSELAFNPPFK